VLAEANTAEGAAMVIAKSILSLTFLILYTKGQFYGMPSAVLWEDQLFVVTSSLPYQGGLLYRGNLNTKQAAVRPPIEYWATSDGLRQSFQAKLDIRGDRILWFQTGEAHTIIPLVDLQLLERTEYANRLCKLRGYSDQRDFENTFNSGGGWRLLFPEHREHDVPLPPEGGFGGGRIEDPEYAYTRRARYDVQLAGPKSVRLFHAYKDKLFVSIEPDWLNNWCLDKNGLVAKNLPKAPDRQLRIGKLPAEFTERFAAYTSDNRDYLVTINGTVYMSVPKGKAELEVTKVWDDPKRKIVGVVQDQANDAVYGWGFATDSAAPERFYVKFAPKPVAVDYKRTVPVWNDRSDAYLESYECARAFRKAAEKK
jgi:hypothetical protein